MENKRGFTLVELLTVIMILGILMAVAVPSIMGISKKLKNRGLDSKIDAITQAAVVYAQENSNKIKAKLGGSCKENNDHCECTETDSEGRPTDCKYVFTMTADDLISIGAYKSEKSDESTNTCDIEDPRNSGFCLDCVKITVKLDDDYKNATAEINKDDVKDATTTCQRSAILK